MQFLRVGSLRRVVIAYRTFKALLKQTLVNQIKASKCDRFSLQLSILRFGVLFDG